LPDTGLANQWFAGNCTSQVEFYNSTDDYNYKRAVIWSIVMVYLLHTHPTFEMVYTIKAINEPLQDANLTPGLGHCEFSIFFSFSNPLKR
ncbi:glycoside hydrolase family 5 protein, partial [Piloderma croceum F 1598]